MAIITNFNITQQFRSSADDNMVANAGGAPPGPEITQCDAMIEGAILPDTHLRIHNNATEVMNAQAFANLSLRRKRDAGSDLCKPLEQKSARLRWNAVLVTPAKNTVHEKGVESLR
jgi:hypothetical protein